MLNAIFPHKNEHLTLAYGAQRNSSRKNECWGSWQLIASIPIGVSNTQRHMVNT